MADASNPNGITHAPATHVIAGYIGGDTPHVWSDLEWHRPEFDGYRKLPIFVRSTDVGLAGGREDAFTALHTLYHLRIPKGTAVVYDRETSTDKDGTQGFINVMSWAGYGTMPYGSKDNILDHPAGNGLWVADPTNVAHMYKHAGVNATQYQFSQTYDLSVVKFWFVEREIGVW